MTTIHSVKIRWSQRYERWFAYTDSGVLFYLDFTFANMVDKLQPGEAYEVIGKIYPPSQRVENGPAFNFMVSAYTLLSAPVAPVSTVEDITL